MESDIPTNAPQSCPGTSSLAAGKSTGCDGCPNQKLCASGTGGISSEISSKIGDRLKNIKNIILVLSGKGGVGKSSITSCLAYALNHTQKDRQVAVLDIDITGPSIPTMLGCTGEQVHPSSSGWSPVYVNENLSVMSVGFLLSNPDQAIIWRGPKKNKMIEQMLSDVHWGDEADKPIDFLIVDTPPGTTDEHMSIVEYLKAAGVFGKTNAIVVTTPQEVALQDVRKQIGFCGKVGLPIVGVVGSMISYSCSNCHFDFDVFPSTTGGVSALCDQYQLPLLAQLPLDSGVAWCLDHGVSIFDDDEYDAIEREKRPNELSLLAIETLVGNLIKQLGECA